ncbi:site-specific integrase [Pseudoclavibacter sp. AY1H1]|uniref:site-specific integrase n=1 Tax=Pseudoclavibacter sp. AY1H1 TaxID=2080584 RepID=UPI000CE7C2B6|nr:site-specific integrase [Pseudoclavibacter sp. AY1H1]PPF39935.1 site-specific integrase [Pseudoclavibacter sp. AY1H1]
MATIQRYETASGNRYRVRYRKPDGKQTDRRGFKTKREAEAFANTVEVSKLRGEFVSDIAGRATVRDLGTQRLARRKAVLKASTWHTEDSAWRVHVEPKWGDESIGRIRSSAVEAWISELHGFGLSPTSIARCWGVLYGILDDAVRDKLLVANAAAGVKRPRKTRAPRAYLSHAQVEALAATARTAEHGTIVLTLAYTGMRWGEMTGLRVRHLDMLRRRIHVEENAVRVGSRIVTGTPKSHERRSVPFPAFLANMLARQCEGKGRDALVFGNGVDHIKPPATDHAWFAAASDRCRTVDQDFPAKITPHDLRHTAASLAVQSGAHVKAVQRMLGHASAAMTLDTYADLFEDDLDDVATALDKARSTALTAPPRAHILPTR